MRCFCGNAEQKRCNKEYNLPWFKTTLYDTGRIAIRTGIELIQVLLSTGIVHGNILQR